MKTKVYSVIAAVLLIAAISIPAAFAAQDSSIAPSPASPGVEKQINLTDAQKDELKRISNQMFELKKQMVQKYLEFGVISKDQADSRLKRIEEMQKKMEEKGFTPGYGRGFGKHGKGRKGTKNYNQQPKTTD